MGGLLIVLIVLIVLFNIVIGLSNISSIVNYCLETNTTNQYWKYFFKNCVSGRAIYSSIFMFFTGLLIYIILVPTVLIRSFFVRSKIKNQFLNGQLFDYSSAMFSPVTPKEFDTNLIDFAFENNSVQITGNLIEDLNSVTTYFDLFCKAKQLEFRHYVNFEIYILETDKAATAPLIVYIGDSIFSIYFIYEDFQKKQFSSVKEIIAPSKFKDCIYFSTVGEV